MKKADLPSCWRGKYDEGEDGGAIFGHFIYKQSGNHSFVLKSFRSLGIAFHSYVKFYDYFDFFKDWVRG